MAKGYWIARVDVSDPEQYAKYVSASAGAYEKYEGVALARGGRFEAVEGTARGRNVIWEFPSFEAAVACFRSPEYQTARALRESAGFGEFVMVEGVE
ncbi:MAG: hypothetical protein QOF79_1657 [Actinomycetota bacterium]|jgi:uncharacterized protein (DUF1330 family)|nr:hypothetical protein [Actinomycetota bacterium]